MITSDTTATATEMVAEMEAILGPDDQIREEITGILDGLGALKKVKSLTDESREKAAQPLLTALAESIGKLGEPVARGNTLYFLPPGFGELVVIDLTPKTLVRL